MLSRFPVKIYQFGPPLALLCIALIVFLFPDNWQLALRYDVDQLQAGQLWRVMTGHILHTNYWHLLLNCLGIILLWSLHGDYYDWRVFLLVTLGLILGCSVGLWFFSPEMTVYVGLSGALHGLFVWGSCSDIQHKLHSGWVLLLGIAVKIYYEQIDGASEHVSQLIDAEVAIDAHLYGAIVGLVMFALVRKKTPQ
ncbi:MAG: rhombosortase [Aestuariibacter sp.]